MPANPPNFDDEVSYVSGVDASGVLISPSFATLNGGNSDNGNSAAGTPTYSATESTAAKFATGSSSLAGTASGTITYAFDPASGYTATEQSVYLSSMALWSAEANVTFAVAANYAGATLQFTRGTSGAFASARGGNRVVAVGTSALPNNGQAYVSIDSSGGFGPVVSVNGADGKSGYPATTIVHEIGHTLGLGHTGGYNGAVTSSTQQFSQYDMRLYSIMSYISPTDTGAKYYGSYAVTGTSWGDYQAPETPMMVDIAAIQRLYGLPASTPLSGGQVFGYHSNITGELGKYFDFTRNSQPVLTLWDAGANNTLDLSGYSAGARVNLNAGTFSSANGLVNNIGIAYNTAINTAVGGSGDDVFVTNDAADTIDGGAGANTAVFSGMRADYTLGRLGATITVAKNANAVVSRLTNVSTLAFADSSVLADSIACFAHGTLIRTPGGEVAVERLAIGDLVVTVSGAHRAIRWLGRRSYAGRFFQANGKVRPVRFAAGSLGDGLPRRALLVSPEHAMFLAGALFPASALVNGSTIRVDTACDRVDYVHVELDDHDVIFAEGAATETFLDDDSRAMFHNAGEYHALYGAQEGTRLFCAPRINQGAALQAVRMQLASLARSEAA